MNVDMPASAPTSPTPPHHGLSRHAVTAFVALFLLIFIFGGVALFRGAAQQPSTVPSPTGTALEPTRSFDPQSSMTPVPTVTPPPVTRVRRYIYTIENTGPRKVGDLTVRQQGREGPELRMDDNGMIYYLESGNVYAYSLATQEKQLLYTNADTDATVMNAEMSRNGKLYVTIQQKPIDGVPQYYVIEDTLSAGKTRTLGPIAPVAYGGVRYLFNTDYGDVMMSVGGDGCSTFGVIMKLKDERKDISEIGSGCSENPTFLGINPDIYSVYLARPKAESFPDVEYVSFDALNVVSEQTAQEYDLTSLGNPVRQVLMEGQTAAFLTDTYAVLFDIEKKTAGPKISIPKVTDYGWVLSGTTLYGSSHTEGPNIAVDMTSGAVRNIVLTGVKSADYSFKYLGSWKKRPIFYVDATE